MTVEPGIAMVATLLTNESPTSGFYEKPAIMPQLVELEEQRSAHHTLHLPQTTKKRRLFKSETKWLVVLKGLDENNAGFGCTAHN